MDETTQAQPTETQAPVTEQPAGETTNAQVQAELAPTQAETTAPEVSEVAEPTTGTDAAPTSNEGATPVVADAQKAEPSAEAAPAGNAELDAPVTEVPVTDAPTAPAVETPAAETPVEAPAPAAAAADTSAPEPTATQASAEAPAAVASDAPVVQATEVAAPASEVQASVETPAPEVTGAPMAETTVAADAPAEAPVAEAAPVVAAPPLVQEVAGTADETPAAPLTEFQQAIKKIMDEGTAVQKQVVQRLEAYVESMAPGKPVEPSTGAALQYELWSVIEFIFDAAPREEFTMLWNLLLAYFREHEKGVFGARYVNRFSESWKNSSMKLTGFQRILNLLSVTARPENRAEGLKSVDINSTLTNGITPEGRARILGFYNK
jgi:hypothetical protein